MREIISTKNKDELNRLAADQFAELAAESIKARGRFAVALSGGSTPKALFQLLANEYKDRIEWPKILFFFGDERNVPPDDDQSNFRMANENLFLPLGIKDENVVRWRTELGPEKAAEDYGSILETKFWEIPPVFDLIYLGMGPDGHTASLFPGTMALDEAKRFAVANDVPQMNTIRLTLTYPVINAARNIVFLVAGSDKAEMLKKVLNPDADPHELPSRGIIPRNGRLFWFTSVE